ncbi:MAG: hypothetical protein FD147_2360 [Chloroflexi bacterium]|nr:MAG: hypothetical protein FD147_2360 [Chloroflexota bacterium]
MMYRIVTHMDNAGVFGVVALDAGQMPGKEMCQPIDQKISDSHVISQQ